MSAARSQADDALDAELEVVEALADRAMAAWNDRLSPADRARVREVLVEALATHPNAARLVAELARPPVVEASGEVGDAPGDAQVDADAKERARGRTK